MKGNPVLLLGLFDTAITTARCFKSMNVRIYGMDYNPNHLGFNSNLIEATLIKDPKLDESKFLNDITEWLRERGGKFVVIPTSDEFVQLLSKYKVELSEYCAFLIPESVCVNNIIDRKKQFDSAQLCGLKVPNYKVGTEEFMDSEFEFPVAIKPRNSPEWKKVFNNKGFVAKDKMQLHLYLDEVKKSGVDYIVQNVLDGDNTNNYEVNSIYFPNGKLTQHVIRKIRQYPDRFGTATCIESVNNHELEILAEKLIRDMNIIGFSNIEFKLDVKKQQYYYIEVNPRVWLQINFSKNIGVNFPELYYNYCTSKNVDFDTFQGAEVGKKWVDFLPDLLYWKRYRKIYRISLLSVIKSWFPFRGTSLLSLTDIKPFLKDLRLSTRIKNFFSIS